MNKIIKLSQEAGVHSEILKKQNQITRVGYQDGKLESVTKKLIEDFSFRVINNGRLGAVYGSHLKNQKKILESAIELSKSGNKVDFNFSDHNDFPNLKLHSRKTGKLGVRELIEAGDEIREILSELTPVNPDIFLSATSSKIESGTTNGASGKYKKSQYSTFVSLPIPASAGSVSGHITDIKPKKFKKKDLKQIVRLHKLFSKNYTPHTDNLPVIFTPDAFMWFMFSFLSGISGASLVKGISPLEKKLGHKIFSDKITILDDPLTEKNINSVPFDDEGVKTTRKHLVKDGVLESFIFDLETGAKLGKTSTGNGFKASLFGASISTPPTPMTSSIKVNPGKFSDKELIKQIDKGLYIDQVLGFHSGNYIQGQFSVSVGVGLYIEKGKLRGRLVDTMISGNIYDLLNRIIEISRNTDETHIGELPWIVLDGVKVSGK